MYDETYENDLLTEIRRLEEENTTLKATIGIVRKVLELGGDTGRIIDSLGTVG